jgi:DNA repair protein RecN (Recombination protein N)
MIRQSAAKKLAKKIEDSLKELNFLQVSFDISVTELEDFNENGFNEVEFIISTNPGEPMREVASVASGGELSRIMLAIKTVLADSDEIPTLIFDEIDTGISGRTAQQVSEKLSYIGKKHQVLCITHLPQIAAMANEHFLIEKNIHSGKTQTKITKLSKEESVNELARLLGGAKITDAVWQNALEMKELAVKTQK